MNTRDGGIGLSESGFTIIELMITVAVLGIVATVAVPNFRDFIINNQRVSLSNKMVADLHLARSEAVKRSENVVTCGSEDGATCSGTNIGWKKGWIVFVDLDDNDQLDVTDTVLRTETVSTNSFNITGTVSGVTYTPSGVNSSGSQIKICHASSEYSGNHMTITASGRILQSKKTAVDC